ncbi:hypothetical protein P9112_005616 [Eukaryota sp. TZLM1-RC]
MSSPSLNSLRTSPPQQRLKMAQAVADRLAIEMELRRSDIQAKNKQHYNSALAQHSRQSASLAAERLRAEMDLRRAALFHRVHSMIEQETLARQTERREQHLRKLSDIEQRSLAEQQERLNHLRQGINATREERNKLSEVADKDLENVKIDLIKQVHQQRMQEVEEEVKKKQDEKISEYKSVEEQKEALLESLGVDQSLVDLMSKLSPQTFDEEGKKQYQELNREVKEMKRKHVEQIEELEGVVKSAVDEEESEGSVDDVREQREIIKDQLSKFNQQHQILLRLQDEHLRVVEELKLLEKEKSNAESSLEQVVEDYKELSNEKAIHEKKLKTEVRLIKTTLATREKQLDEIKKQREKERERAELLNQQLREKQEALAKVDEEKELLKKKLRSEWELELKIKEEVQFVVSWLICETVSHFEHWQNEERKKKDQMEKRKKDLQLTEDQTVEELSKTLAQVKVQNDCILEESDSDDLSFVEDDLSGISDVELDNFDDLGEFDQEILNDDVDTSDIDLADFSEGEIDELVEVPLEYRRKLKELLLRSKEKR